MSQLSADLIERALSFALRAHSGQLEKNGHPYIMHPLRLMMSMETDEERLVALLHDVVEDCDDVSFEDLGRLGLPECVMDALRLLTHDDHEPYNEYIARVGEHPIARRVKLADLRDNMDARRLPKFSERDAERMRKYVQAYDALNNG